MPRITAGQLTFSTGSCRELFCAREDSRSRNGRPWCTMRSMVEYAVTPDDRNGFAGTRSRAREAFVECFSKAGWHSRTLVNPHARDPAGNPVTLEVGWIGPRDAPNVLMSLSGTHGIEAFAGSAAQLGLARDLAAGPLPPGTAVFFIHGYNGFGWSHASRANESNVDLNRNMVDFAQTLPQNPLYAEAVHELFAPAELSADPVEQMREGMAMLGEKFGHDALIDAINRGQFTHADGVYHGGKRREWSSTTLLALIREYLPKAKRVAFIDWHTGMGSFGDTFLICFHDPKGPRFAEAAKWWGRENLLDESGYDDAPRPTYQGVVINEVERAIDALGGTMIGTVIEFGTYEPERVESGIMIDRTLRYASGQLSASRIASLREHAQETFIPDSQRWRDSVAAKARTIYAATLSGLAG